MAVQLTGTSQRHDYETDWEASLLQLKHNKSLLRYLQSPCHFKQRALCPVRRRLTSVRQPNQM